jgi:hypothetical protein
VSSILSLKGANILTLVNSIPLTLFKALGTLIAKAFLDSRVLDIPLHPTFVEMVVFGHESVETMTALQVGTFAFPQIVVSSNSFY